MRSGRSLVVGVAAGVVLCASAAHAGEAEVKAPAAVAPPPPVTDAPPVTAAPPAPPPPPPAYQPPPPGYQPPPRYPPYAYPPPGYAGTPPGFHTHDGTYVRLHLGGGYTSMLAEWVGGSLELSGGSVSFGAAVGGAIVPNVIMYASVTLAMISEPTGESNGQSATLSNFNATAGSLGAGGAYYFQPSNFYVAGTLLGTRITLDDTTDNSSATSNIGLGFEGLVGKEWWASDNWGLGVAAQVIFASIKDQDTVLFPSATWTVSSFGLLFSATYN